MKKYIFAALFLALLATAPVLAQTITLEQIIQALQANPTLLTQVRLAIQQLSSQQQNQNCYTFDKDLKRGDSGDEVTKLYQYLNPVTDAFVYNFDSIIVEKAVKQFQAKYGIPNTGYVGPLTRAKLNSLYGCKNKVFITPNALEVAKVGVFYNQTINLHGLTDTRDVTWAISSGQLPPGINMIGIFANPCKPLPGQACTLNMLEVKDNRVLNGTPTSAGTYTFTVQASNGTRTAQRTYTLVVKDKDGNTGAPVISGISGPTTLKVGETGTWTIKASDPNNGTLSYSVIWGDEWFGVAGEAATMPPYVPKVNQTSTFTHTYSRAGVYNPTFYVSNSVGQSKTSLSVNVGQTTQPQITVTSPNGGEQWVAKSTQDIKWSDRRETLVAAKYDLYLDPEPPACVYSNPACMVAIQAPYLLDQNISGSVYNWIVATDIVNNPITAGQYRVRICPASSQTNCDSSNAPFTITDSRFQITVLSPNGGEQWTRKSVKTIKWFSSGMEVDRAPKVDLYLDSYWCEPGSVCLAYAPPLIILDKNISGSAYNWIVATDINDAAIPVGNYRVKVCSAGSLTVCDSSNRPFTITTATNSKYDLNGDGIVDNSDLIWYRLNVVSKYELDGEYSLDNRDMQVISDHTALFVKYDLNGSGAVNSQDLLWYQANVLNKYDLTGDGRLDTGDLIDLRLHVGSTDPKYDFNGSGAVDSQDLLWFQANVLNNSAYDLNGDGAASTADLEAIRTYIQNQTKYDVNGDGIVDNGDLIFYRSQVIGKYDFTGDQKCNADDLTVIQNNRG